MKINRLAALAPLLLAAAGCERAPDRPMRAPEVPAFFASSLISLRCELAHAFAERDFVRDLLEPEVTLTVSKNSGITGRSGPSAHSNDALDLASSDTVATVTVADRAPLPSNCPPLPQGQRLPLRIFLDHLQAELAKLPPEVRTNSITYQNRVLLDTPTRAGDRPPHDIDENFSFMLTFRLKQPRTAAAPAAAAPAPAAAPEGAPARQ